MKLSQSLQENVLTLLCFSQKAVPILANSVEVNLFESSIYREIASQALGYYAEFKKPISDHLPDVFEYLIEGKDKKKGELYAEVISNLHGFKDDINEEYVLKSLGKFARTQNLKKGIKRASELLLQKDDVDAAELALEEYRKVDLSLFDAGTFLKDPSKSLSFLTTVDNSFPMGIEHLDTLGICPAPKELMTLLALPNRGKSWFLTHIGKYAMLQRKKVLHITLEMSEDKCSGRYMQSLFGISKRRAVKDSVRFETDDLGKLLDISFDDPQEGITLSDGDILKSLTGKLSKIRNPNLIIKEFPTGQLTINHLKAYLEGLASHYNFRPDIILLDYADLMAIDTKNLRVDTGRVYKELRGIAVEYNLAMVTASQANRVAEKTKWLTGQHIAEDYSKVAISDNLLTFNQTPLEYQLNMARLLVEKSRNDRKGDRILISQAYELGQFCLDSVKLNENYWGMIDEFDLDEVADED